jgi:hypothetical protein
VNKKFSTRYYLNLVLIDEENRRYFKQQVTPPYSLTLYVTVPFIRSYIKPFVGNHGFPDTRSEHSFSSIEEPFRLMPVVTNQN